MATPTPPAAKPTINDFQWIAAYATMIVLLMLAARTRFGYVTIYYALSLLLFTLVLLNAKFITNILAPLTSGG